MRQQQNCIDCGKPVKSGNICLPFVEKRYPSKGNRGSEIEDKSNELENLVADIGSNSETAKKAREAAKPFIRGKPLNE